MDEDQATLLAHNVDFGRIYDIYPIEYLTERFKLDALTIVWARYLKAKEAAHRYGLLSDDEVPPESE